MLCPLVNNTNPNKPLSKRGDKIKIQINLVILQIFYDVIILLFLDYLLIILKKMK